MPDHKEHDLDPVLLRSFLAVAETLHFTAAASRRGLGQSTISQHVGRLEQIVGRTLLTRSNKSVALTGDGAAMVTLAREVIAANDRAIGFFDSGSLRGRLRFGLSEDVVLSALPDLLRAFRAEHPLIELELTVGLSSRLYELLDTGRLDLMFSKRQPGDERGIVVWHERLVWLGSPQFVIGSADPVPLVLFPGASITRRAAIDALNNSGRKWHVAFSSESLSALTAGLRAGFGVSAQSSLLASADLPEAPAESGLPTLSEVDFILLGQTRVLLGPAEALQQAILSRAETLKPRIARLP